MGDPVSAAGGSDAAAVAPSRWLTPLFAFAATCYLLAPYLGLSSRTVDPRIAELWPPGGVGFVLLTTVWGAHRRVLTGTLASMVVVFAATEVALGVSVAAGTWASLAGTAQPVLMIVLYRRWAGRETWVPATPRSVGALLLATVSSSLALGLVGGFPHLGPGEVSPELGWWVVRNTVFCFVGGLTFLVIFYAPRSRVLRPSSLVNRVGLLATAGLCVYGTYLDSSLPLSWLLIIPSVWGGLTLTVRGTAYLSLTVALSAAALTYLPENQFGYRGLFPASSIIDVLVIASTGFAVLLTLMREQRGQLIGELDRRGAQSESQRRMLETVFNSMTDGVVILDEGLISMYNPAARQLLGQPMPTGNPRSWSETLGLRTPEGLPLPEAALVEGLWVQPDEASVTASLEVMVGPERSGRVLDMSARAIGSASRRSTMILLHDVTAQRARLRELGNFAGMVAHDLRGPLTVLDGWLEVVQDERAQPDGHRGGDEEGSLTEEALARARDASKRMRQVIEDWLSYTVVQNGQLRPEATKLHEVATEVVEGRLAHRSDSASPQFHLDLDHSVLADPGLLRQLLDNLVGNAIKYTPAGQAPWVQVSSDFDGEPGWVHVEVTDHGVGIPEGQEELIFEEFHRGPQQGRSAGTGLGLALARRIVSLHGGRLSARRNPEGGSTFSLTLPEA